MKIHVSHVVGLVEVEDVKVGWEIRHKQAWRRVTLSQCRSASRPGGWTLHVAGRSTPLHFLKRSTVTVMAPVEGVEPHPFLPDVPTVKPGDMVLPVEPYVDGKNDGKLYITRPQATLLAELLRVYLPVLEDKGSQAFVMSLRSVLTRFAEKGN